VVRTSGVTSRLGPGSPTNSPGSFLILTAAVAKAAAPFLVRP
jgi:hypothetical protein